MLPTTKASYFQILDAELNSAILYTLLHGIYTDILAATLWNIFINKRWLTRRAMVVVIILLHALITINFAAHWSYISSAFIENGQNFWTVYLELIDANPAYSLKAGISASMSSILTDLYMIWCCWIIWGRRWLVILVPIFSIISATGSKIIAVYHEYCAIDSPKAFSVVYILFLLTTTLWCTLSIIYRILTVTGVSRAAEGRQRVYHRLFEVLLESSALYSIALILDLALTFQADNGMYYFDAIASIAKGIAPTLLIGRAAAGHTRPNDDYDESTVSSLHFQASSEVGTTSFQESTTDSAVIETDIEAQRQQSDKLVVVVERRNSSATSWLETLN